MGEEGEVGEEVAGDEEGLVEEEEGLEVAESEGEEGGIREEGHEAAEVAPEEGGDGVGELPKPWLAAEMTLTVYY